jgi:ParB family chromosome partitioning protein
LTLHQIQLPAQQPRRYFDERALSDLVASVRQYGILQPLLVRPLEEGKYELVAGERRYRAAQEAGLTAVPVVVRQFTNNEALQLSLIENLQREDLNPVEETEGILQLLSLRLDLSAPEVISLLYRLDNQQKTPLTHNVVGDSSSPTHNVVGDSAMSLVQEVFESLGGMQWTSFVKHRLPLLKLPPEILAALRTGKIAYTKAQAIAKVKEESARRSLLEAAIADGLSLSQIKERIQSLKAQSQLADAQEKQLSARLTQINRLVKKTGVGSDPEKRQQVEALLGQLEALLSPD